MTESVLDRKFAGGFTLERILYFLLALTAVSLCLVDLGSRPYHHDEAIHAYYSWKISQDGPSTYRYDPVYHGLVLYYAGAAVMKVLGDSDFTGRLSAVLFGLGTMAFAWPLRRYVGRWGAICFLALLTISPTWIYFTRFVRHDVYLAFFVIMSIYAAFRFGETRRPGWMYLGGFALGMAACTKEDMYLLGPWFVLSFVVMLLWGVARGEQKQSGAIRETTDFLKRSAVPFLTALLIFFTVWLLIYSSLGTNQAYANLLRNPSLLFKPALDAIAYWGGQHTSGRIANAWWYYLPQLALYEPLIFFGGIASAATLVFQKRVPDRFARFLALWGIGALLIYAWAQEKVPWLLVPQVLPLALLSGRFFGGLIERGTMKNPLVAVPTVLFVLVMAWSTYSVNFLWGAPRPDETGPKRHAEMLVYVQSTYDITDKVMRSVHEVGKRMGSEEGTRLQIWGEATWPLSWYLRRYPVNYSANPPLIDAPIVIADRTPAIMEPLDRSLGERYDKVPFQIRGWWTWEKFSASSSDIWNFIAKREAWGAGVGSSDAVMYVLKPGATITSTAVTTAASAPKGYDSGPSAVSAAASWGKAGSGRGEFAEPRDLAVDTAGNVYIADTKNHRIQKLSAAGNVLAVWGTEGDGPGQFKEPCGVAVAPDGSVFVADTWNHRVQSFDPAGTFLRQWRDESGFFGPRGIAVSSKGVVYITDTGNKRVVSYSQTGERLHSWGGEGAEPGKFVEPVGIDITASGLVVVADTGNRRLQFFDAEGGFVKEWSVKGWKDFYTEPYVAAMGEDVFVTDSSENRLARYHDGEILASWGGEGSGGTSFSKPTGLATAGYGVVYVTDSNNSRIQRLVVP